MKVHLQRKSDFAMVASQTLVADTYWTRLRGLIGKRDFSVGEGMLFPECKSVHLWMMSVSIDVLFLKALVPKKEWIVISMRSELKPWKLLPVGSARADDVLELPSGTIARLNLKEGEVLCIAS